MDIVCLRHKYSQNMSYSNSWILHQIERDRRHWVS